jgi:hypothetical protein
MKSSATMCVVALTVSRIDNGVVALREKNFSRNRLPK